MCTYGDNSSDSLLYLDSVVFFFKQKTAYEMRISDWSSDVCSSDLAKINIFVRIGLQIEQLRPESFIGDVFPASGPHHPAARLVGRHLQDLPCLAEGIVAFAERRIAPAIHHASFQQRQQRGALQPVRLRRAAGRREERRYQEIGRAHV